MSASRHRVDSALFTVVVTSCGRFDLLEEMVVSFNRHFDADRIIIAEDSADHDGARAFAARHPNVTVHINDPKLGQLRSIDRLYAAVETPYVIHLEDDWIFVASIDLEHIVKMLEAKPKISVALLAHREYAPHMEREARIEALEGFNYKIFSFSVHPLWFSYSFNPSIARVSLWKDLESFQRFETEEKLSGVLKERGMRIALLWPPVGHHIGDDRHVPDPFQPQRPRNLLERLARSVRKRVARITGRA